MAYRPYRGFSWNISSYYPMALQEGHTEKELRKEYAKLRSVAQKSLKRLGESRYRDSETYRQNIKHEQSKRGSPRIADDDRRER